MSDRLTAEADDDDAVYVRVAGKAGEDLLAHRRVVRDIGAPGVEDDVHRAPDMACDDAARLGTTGTTRQDEDVVADARAAFGAAVAPELRAVFGRDDFDRFRVGTVIRDQFVIIGTRNTVDVLMVHPVTGRNGRVRLADEFTILDDFIAFPNIHKRDLVTIRNGFFRDDGLDGFPVTPCDGLTFCDFTDTGHDVIFLIE